MVNKIKQKQPRPQISAFKRISKVGLLSAVALTMGVVGTTMHPTIAHGATYNKNAEVGFTPKFQKGKSQFIPIDTGALTNSKYTIDDGDIKNTFYQYRNKSKTVVKYTHVSNFNGKDVDMLVTVNNAKIQTPRTNTLVDFLVFGTDHISVSMDTGETYLNWLDKNMMVELKFVEHTDGRGIGKPINLGDNSVGLAYSDLEPQYVKINGKRTTSLNQRVQNAGAYVPVIYWKDLPRANSLIDRGRAKGDNFITSENVAIPNDAWSDGGGGYVNILNNWRSSGAVAVYPPGKNTITVRLDGSAPRMDLFYFSDADITVKPKPVDPVPQPKPIKKIDYNGKKTESTSMVNAKDKYTYEITTHIKKDNIVSGKGYRIEDKIPDGFVVDKIASSGETHRYSQRSVEETNKSHVFEVQAKENVFDKDSTITYRLEGHIPVSKVKTTTRLNNKATVIVPRGSAGGGDSNNTVVNIPRRDITFNYYNFDHNGDKLRASKVYKNIPVGYGIDDKFVPDMKIKDDFNKFPNKDFNMVKSKDNRTDIELSNRPVYDDSNTRTATNIDMYYVTTWKSQVNHYVKGTTFNENTAVNPDGSLLARETDDVYYKSIDGRTVNDFGYHVRNDLRDSKGMPWIPIDTGGTKKVVESDTNNRADLPYEHLTITSKIDWVQLDTVKASKAKMPFEMRYTNKINRAYPLYDTSKMPTETKEQKEVKSYADATNAWYKNLLTGISVKTTAYNNTTGTHGFTQVDKLITDPDNMNGKTSFSRAYKKKSFNDTKLTKDTKNNITVQTELDESSTNIANVNVNKANTNIHTATEQTLTNADIDGTNHLDVQPEIRTLYVGETGKVNSYKEHLTMNFNPKVDIKTGYFTSSDIRLAYKSDTDQEKFHFDNFAYSVPKKLRDGDRKASNANSDSREDMVIKSPMSSIKEPAGEAPNLPDLDSWKKQDYYTSVNYQQRYSDMKSGDLHTTKELAERPSSSTYMLNAGEKYYVPVWADVQPFRGTYENKKFGSTSNYPLGVNQINYKLVKDFNVIAQMYSDQDSKTEKKDELSMQPIFTDSEYDNLPKHLNAKDKSWLTTVDDNSTKD